ncbi:hypothetical protein XBO1_1240083 [Xenorhabdus bovienii str. oregonense]|uniref:Phage tail protein C-terminal domain-containing protein n=1 Tax=Xenorhabdus bovienii str. oregonense TaxID=1398202 RepID=A0A077NQK4_XENBV|nr:hypothetical protein [Xenorhabdus bovienii]CDH04382.1 hypothetical protein XBO1_1240083 [Xenorhabdus bovienii str. oregonense]
MKIVGLAETVTKAEGALQRSGGEVTGNIAISTDTEIAWRRNTDYAGIGFKNTGDGDTDSYMWFRTGDNGNEYFKWQHSLSGGGTTEWMSLDSDNLRVKGHQVYHEGHKPTAADMGAATTKWVSDGFFKQETSSVVTKGAWPRVNFLPNDRNHDTHLALEVDFAVQKPRLRFYERKSGTGNNLFVVHFPNRNGTITVDSDYTIDGNGFLKRASPIIQIYSDGQYKTNNESEGAVVQRLSEGVYLIKNVLGFNADAAWGGADGGVEIPLCKNKLPLIWVNYEVLPDGTIKLMTYHREHPDVPAFAKNVRQGYSYSDGDLIDIPNGRFISVRVQMPEDSVWNQQRKLVEGK